MLSETEFDNAVQETDVLKQRLQERISQESDKASTYSAVRKQLEKAREAMAFYNDRYPTDVVFLVKNAQQDLDEASMESSR